MSAEEMERTLNEAIEREPYVEKSQFIESIERYIRWVASAVKERNCKQFELYVRCAEEEIRVANGHHMLTDEEWDKYRDMLYDAKEYKDE